MVNISEILRTLRGSRQLSSAIDATSGAGRGITRRSLLKGLADGIINRGDIPEGEWEGLWNEASDLFKQHPGAWNPEWGPIEEAQPEDLIDAAIRVFKNP